MSRPEKEEKEEHREKRKKREKKKTKLPLQWFLPNSGEEWKHQGLQKEACGMEAPSIPSLARVSLTNISGAFTFTRPCAGPL